MSSSSAWVAVTCVSSSVKLPFEMAIYDAGTGVISHEVGVAPDDFVEATQLVLDMIIDAMEDSTE